MPNPNYLLGFRAPQIDNPIDVENRVNEMKSGRLRNALADMEMARMQEAEAYAQSPEGMASKQREKVIALNEARNRFINDNLGDVVDQPSLDYFVDSVRNTFGEEPPEQFKVYGEHIEKIKQSRGIGPKPQNQGMPFYLSPDGTTVVDRRTGALISTGQRRLPAGATLDAGGNIVAAPPTGSRNVFDADGNLLRQDPLPGSKQYRADIDKYASDEKTAKLAAASDASLQRQINDLLANKEGMAGIFGLVDSWTPNLKKSSIRAQTQFNTIKDLMQTSGMKELRMSAGSPGSMTEAEWPKMEAAFGALAQATSEEDAVAALQEIQHYSSMIKNVAQSGFETEWKDSQYWKQPSAPAGGDYSGLWK